MRPILSLLLAAALCSAADQPAFTTTESIQKETRATALLLERLHISRRAMSTVDMREVLLTYCENLDRMKMYFTQAEVDEFVERYAKSLDLYMERGNLTPAFEIYALFSRKAEERARLVKDALGKPVDLGRDAIGFVQHPHFAWVGEKRIHVSASPGVNAVVRKHVVSEIVMMFFYF